jgi:uncharacterized membrane protein
MASSGMLRRVALVRTDVSEELSASITRVDPSSPILVTLMVEALSSYEASVITRATRRNTQKTPLTIRHDLEAALKQDKTTHLKMNTCT